MSAMIDLVNQVRVNTSQGLNDPINVLDEPWNPGDPVVVMRYPVDTVLPGTLMSAGLTTWQVLVPQPLARRLEVLASPNGEVAMPVAPGTLVRIRPRYTDASILALLNGQIRLMSSSEKGLYGVVEWEDRGNSSGSYVIPPMTAARVTDLAAVYTSSVLGHNRARQLSGFSLQKINGNLIVTVVDEAGDTIGQPLHFVGKRAFTAAQRLEEDPIANCGLTESMLDIPVFGASAQLLWSGESRRAQLSSQGDSRRPDEVAATANSSMAREWMRVRDARIQEEYARLLALYPPVRGRW